MKKKRGYTRCKMSLNAHFLHFHVDYFPENLVHSEEQGEIFKDVDEI